MQKQTDKQPKFCKDCKHFGYGEIDGFMNNKDIALCSNNKINQLDLVTGCYIVKWAYTARNTEFGMCGKDAKYFEPKFV